jgi:hypothetical protein
MTAILRADGNPTDPAELQLTVTSEWLDVGTVLSFEIASANAKGEEFLPLAFSESPPYPVYIWDWLQYLYIKYDDDCDYANVSFGKAEQINEVDFRPKVYPRRQAEYVEVSNLTFTPAYSTVEPSRERIYNDINAMLERRVWKECPPIALLFNRRVTQLGDVRVTANGDTRITREAING